MFWAINGLIIFLLEFSSELATYKNIMIHLLDDLQFFSVNTFFLLGWTCVVKTAASFFRHKTGNFFLYLFLGSSFSPNFFRPQLVQQCVSWRFMKKETAAGRVERRT